ncbi:class I SAM-dependent methyltransferase [Prauserella cavernicola]|uniref:Methyltransferase domain-containing protein n=1 Tax=Prauserella cavernicola TaxID=2800127 RepID=A0A934QZ77_9PSEU|nr:class I SAM-dependent methyltransferase [Prauserella cavernicola]MBK1789271.1 methyltransferase domain-containing protein [Prauserella cavernicola]
MSAHTHDDVDWASRLSSMRRLDALERESLASVATRLTNDLPADATVVDVGSGSGGMSAALAAALRERGGGTLVLVDAVDELLAAALEAARDAGGSTVAVETVVADLGTAMLHDLVDGADLIWGSAVVHHLPDQQLAITRLADALHPGGLLAIAEGGLEARCLPWDLGIGEPGLEGRLAAAREDWFRQLRATMPDSVRMPYGWGTALRQAGLTDIGAFSYLLDHPAPTTQAVVDFTVERTTWLSEIVEDRLGDGDRAALRRLLDPAGPDYLGSRDDLYLLNVRTVHCGWHR